VLYHVARDRDGRSFSSRHVNAVQEGEVIFSMLASFHVGEPSGTWEPEPHRQVDPPADVAATPFWDALVDMRELTPSDEANGRYCDLFWVRAAHPLPDDPIVHACALTYVSDFGSGFGQVTVDGMASSGTSLDHAVWFQSPLRLDDWVLVDLWPTKAGGARGLYAGSIRGADGRLGAMIGQEMLQRQHRSPDS
jgi:acyl-CoA thioesterase-2